MTPPTRTEQALVEDLASPLQHRDEWAVGWQYCTVWRFQDCPTPYAQSVARDWFPGWLYQPPAGDGWERNVDIAWRGYEAVVPSWCKDDTVIQQRVYWRRQSPGMHPFTVAAHLNKQRE